MSALATVRCPCGHGFQIRMPDAAGRRVRCPECLMLHDIPAQWGDRFQHIAEPIAFDDLPAPQTDPPALPNHAVTTPVIVTGPRHRNSHAKFKEIRLVRLLFVI